MPAIRIKGIVTPVSAVTARAPAKINLQLAVGPPRAHGYHDVVTVFHAVSLFDEVTVTPAERNSVSVTGEGADSVPANGTNLAARAVTTLLGAVGPGAKDSPGVAIRISKRIPVAAGLAGGSADAAAALVACNELWRTGLSQAELCELAAGIGSDVAFGLVGGTAIGLGRGEQVTPALAAGTYHWVLAFATSGLSTPAVYAALTGSAPRMPGRTLPVRLGETGRRPGRGTPAPRRRQARPGWTRLLAALRSGEPRRARPLLSNDLQPAALSLRPELSRALAVGMEHGAAGGIVSGSGPTVVPSSPGRARDAEDLPSRSPATTSAGQCAGHRPGPRCPGIPTRPGPTGMAANLVNLESVDKAYGTRGTFLTGVSLGRRGRRADRGGRSQRRG